MKLFRILFVCAGIFALSAATTPNWYNAVSTSPEYKKWCGNPDCLKMITSNPNSKVIRSVLGCTWSGFKLIWTIKSRTDENLSAMDYKALLSSPEFCHPLPFADEIVTESTTELTSTTATYWEDTSTSPEYPELQGETFEVLPENSVSQLEWEEVSTTTTDPPVYKLENLETFEHGKDNDEKDTTTPENSVNPTEYPEWGQGFVELGNNFVHNEESSSNPGNVHAIYDDDYYWNSDVYNDNVLKEEFHEDPEINWVNDNFLAITDQRSTSTTPKPKTTPSTPQPTTTLKLETTPKSEETTLTVDTTPKPETPTLVTTSPPPSSSRFTQSPTQQSTTVGTVSSASTHTNSLTFTKTIADVAPKSKATYKFTLTVPWSFAAILFILIISLLVSVGFNMYFYYAKLKTNYLNKYLV